MKKILLYVHLLITFLCYAQGTKCNLSNLADDLVDASQEFKTLVNTSPGFNAYRLLAEDASSLRTNVEELTLVSKNIEAINASGSYLKWKSFANGVDEFLEGFVGTVRRANAEEIAQASTRIKNHRIEVGNPDRANYGYLEGIVNGQSIDNKIIRSSKPKAGEPEIFRAIEVEGSNGKSWLRNTDSEYKMLNKLADDLGGVSGNKYPNITGEIKIISENPYCKSCQGILHQFSEMYPNIKLILVDGI